MDNLKYFFKVLFQIDKRKNPENYSNQPERLNPETQCPFCNFIVEEFEGIPNCDCKKF